MKKPLLVLLILLFPVKVLATDSSKSSIVMDINSNRVLYENNSNDVRLIASTTKIMTAVLAIESGRLDEEVTAKDEILKMYGTSIYISLHEKMKLRDLVYGLILRSGNDAAVVIANFIAGTEEEFVSMMNEKAKEIGMVNTTFENSHGLDEETRNYSTAKDMALLSSYAYKNLKEYRKISKTTKYLVQTKEKSYLWYNRNKLLTSYKNCTGGKNGYTPSAGRTLVTTASLDNLDLTVVTLKDGNEYQTHKDLYEEIFSKYKYYTVIDKDNFYFNSDKYYIKESFKYPLTNKEKDNLKTLGYIDPSIKTGKAGYIKVTLYNKKLFEIPIYIKKETKKKSLFTKLWN